MLVFTRRSLLLCILLTNMLFVDCQGAGNPVSGQTLPYTTQFTETTSIDSVTESESVVTTTETTTQCEPEFSFTLEVCCSDCGIGLQHMESKKLTTERAEETGDTSGCTIYTVNITKCTNNEACVPSVKISVTNTYMYIVLGAGPVLVLSLIATIISVIVCHCKRRAKKRRLRRESENSQRQELIPENMPLTMQPPPYCPPRSQTSASGGSSSASGCAGSYKRPVPVRPPQKPSLSITSPVRPLSEVSTCSDPPHPSAFPSQCMCGGTMPNRKLGRGLCATEEEEIYNAIARTLGRLRSKPTTLNINMYRSRRMSRSVPDLFSTHHGIASTAPRGMTRPDDPEESDDQLGTLSNRYKKEGRQKKKPAKKTSFSDEGKGETTQAKRPSSSESYPPRQYVRDTTSLHIYDVDTSSGDDVIEVESRCTTQETRESDGYISMNTIMGRERAGSSRTLPDIPPLPQKCGTSNAQKRMYQNIPDETLDDTDYVFPPPPPPLPPVHPDRVALKPPMMPMAFSYTGAVPLLPASHLTSMASPDDDARGGTTLSHESTTVRIYKAGSLRKNTD